jgi:hypothetical protein
MAFITSNDPFRSTLYFQCCIQYGAGSTALAITIAYNSYKRVEPKTNSSPIAMQQEMSRLIEPAVDGVVQPLASPGGPSRLTQLSDTATLIYNEQSISRPLVFRPWTPLSPIPSPPEQPISNFGRNLNDLVRSHGPTPQFIGLLQTLYPKEYSTVRLLMIYLSNIHQIEETNTLESALAILKFSNNIVDEVDLISFTVNDIRIEPWYDDKSSEDSDNVRQESDDEPSESDVNQDERAESENVGNDEDGMMESFDDRTNDGQASSHSTEPNSHQESEDSNPIPESLHPSMIILLLPRTTVLTAEESSAKTADSENPITNAIEEAQCANYDDEYNTAPTEVAEDRLMSCGMPRLWRERRQAENFFEERRRYWEEKRREEQEEQEEEAVWETEDEDSNAVEDTEMRMD